MNEKTKLLLVMEYQTTSIREIIVKMEKSSLVTKKQKVMDTFTSR